MALKLKSRRECCPNGFFYRQPETGWELQSWDFFELTRELQKHRQANPQYRMQTDMTAIENEVDAVNAIRVSKIPGAMIYLIEGDLPPPKLSAPASSRVSRLAAGAVTLVEWIKSGADAVSPELSNQRASVCASCSKNNSSDWTKLFTTPVSEAIRHAVSQRKDWNLSTEHDDKLGVCDACLCPLKLKVHMPIAAIVKRLPAESKAALVPECWILAESK